MKIFLTFLAVGVFASVCYGQLEEVFVPCGMERGLTREELHVIGQGDLSKVTNFFGCFIDCVSKKMGMLTDDTFHLEVFEKQLKNLFSEARAKEIMDKCSSKVGTGECNIAKDITQCFLRFSFDTYLTKV